MKQFELDQQAVKEAAQSIVTQSEIMTRAACPRKWYYRYALRLDRKAAPNMHLIYGSMMHAALAELYRSGHYHHSPKEYSILVPNVSDDRWLLAPGDKEEIALVRSKAQIAFENYRWHYYKTDTDLGVLDVEKDYEVVWRGIKLTGRIDLVAYPHLGDAPFVWDFKTAGRFDASMLDAWSFRFQFLFYCWLYWKVTGKKPGGTMANGLAKTALRPKIIDKKHGTKESQAEYLSRVRINFADRRDEMFYRQRMPLPSGMLERFENEILYPHLTTFKMLGSKHAWGFQIIESMTMAMNTGHCHVYNTFCEYLPLCQHGPLMLPEYETREGKHAELTQQETEIGES